MLSLDIEIKVFDPNNIMVYEMSRRPAHSFTRNFYNSFLSRAVAADTSGVAFGDGSLVLKRYDTVVGGLAGSTTPCHGMFYYMVSPDTEKMGIFVGRGTNPWTFNDFTFSSVCANGTGANQLAYANNTAHAAVSWSGGIVTGTVSRLLNNNGTNDVIITESGLVTRGWSASFHFLVVRDVLDSSVTVGPAEQLAVNYIFTADCSPGV
jgi:hypothetical protein